MGKYKLLSDPITNFKASKNLKLGVDTFFLSLAHSDTSGYNVCPMANKINAKENSPNKSNCSAVCVAKNGMGRFDVVINARIRKTKQFFQDREGFMIDLKNDITKAIKSSEQKGNVPTFRLNAYSDIQWENIKIEGKNIFELFENITFYDYTKIPNRVTPNNYHLTYSHWGDEYTTTTQIKNGSNVAMVFDKRNELPKKHCGITVVDGDKTDLRTPDNDGRNVIVGLRAKMSMAAIDEELKKLRSFIVRS